MRWHPDSDLFHGLRPVMDPRLNVREEYERRIASRATVLDIGGRNQNSRSARRLRSLSGNPDTKITCTDIIDEYQPDLVDDITDSKIPDASFDAIYCDAILEHVKDYWTATHHLHRILKPGGEIFIYVPFCWCFHDRMDFHRFTFTEVARLVEGYSERRLFVSDPNGYGGVLTLMLTLFQLQRFPGLWKAASWLVNLVLTIPLWCWYRAERLRGHWPETSWREFRFYFLHLFVSHGVCVWAKK
jgi:SAM-dependent methyltransferase